MTYVAHGREMTVSEATKRGVAGLVADAENGDEVIVTRRNKPVAAVMSMQKVEEMQDHLDDLRDLALVLTRTVTDTAPRVTFDEVLEAYGHTRESLEALPDDEEE